MLTYGVFSLAPESLADLHGNNGSIGMNTAEYTSNPFFAFGS